MNEKNACSCQQSSLTSFVTSYTMTPSFAIVAVHRPPVDGVTPKRALCACVPRFDVRMAVFTRMYAQVPTPRDGGRCARRPNDARGDVCRASTANAALERLSEECICMDKQYRGNLRWFDCTSNTTSSSVPQVLYRYTLKLQLFFS